MNSSLRTTAPTEPTTAVELPAVPEFRPHPLVRGGHAQTLAGLYLPDVRHPHRAIPHQHTLDDGDVVILHEDRPDGWSDGDLMVLLIHGLAGCHGSQYLIRLGEKLYQRGVRVFRIDLRGCGAGEGLSKYPYNAGRSDDLLEVIRLLSGWAPQSSLIPVGFSMGGNLLLKMLGEHPQSVPSSVVRAISVNAPIDLSIAVQALKKPLNRMYDRYFARLLDRKMSLFEEAMRQCGVTDRTPTRGLYDFDNRYTAPLGGFRDADHYYECSSAARVLPKIDRPVYMLTSRNDPLVPFACYEQATMPDSATLHVTPSGGHLGYIANTPIAGDRRWMDWRVLEWILHPERDAT